MSTFTPEPYWLLHHGQLLELTTEPVANRIDYIKNNKPKNEIAIRLEWLRPVKNPERLPKRFVEARTECDKAWVEYLKACTEFNKARAEFKKACTEFDKARTEFDKAWDKHDKARAGFYKAWAEYDKAQAEYNKAWAECMPEIIALHKEECPGCPFDYEKGELIFPPL